MVTRRLSGAAEVAVESRLVDHLIPGLDGALALAAAKLRGG